MGVHAVKTAAPGRVRGHADHRSGGSQIWSPGTHQHDEDKLKNASVWMTAAQKVMLWLAAAATAAMFVQDVVNSVGSDSATYGYRCKGKSQAEVTTSRFFSDFFFFFIRGKQGERHNIHNSCEPSVTTSKNLKGKRKKKNVVYKGGITQQNPVPINFVSAKTNCPRPYCNLPRLWTLWITWWLGTSFLNLLFFFIFPPQKTVASHQH